EAAVDLLETIASIFDGVVRSEQADGHILWWEECVSTTNAMMSDAEFARHPLDDPIHIVPNGSMRQKLFVSFFHRAPIHTMHVWCVEVVAVDAPCFIEDLFPFRARVDANFDRVGVDLSRSHLRLDVDSDDTRRLSRSIQQLLAIGGHLEGVDVRHQDF